VAGLHYEQYVYYVVRSHKNPLPWINSYSVLNEATFLCPIIVILLARKSFPIVLAYASVLFLTLVGRIYLLIPSWITGVDGPSMTMDLSTIILAFVGFFFGLGVIVIAPIVLILVLIDSFRTPSGDDCGDKAHD
jgi:hypothetical protein